MGYLNEDGLARYDGLIKNWVTFKSGTVDGVDPLLNWQKTEAAGIVMFYPLPAAPIDPVVNFSFKETGPASGDKAPDNPSTITGVSKVAFVHRGKNLIKFSAGTTTSNGVTFTRNADGSVSCSGTATGRAELNLGHYRRFADCTYFLSGCPSGGSSSTYYLASYGGSIYDYGEGVSFQTASAIHDVSIVIKEGTNSNGLVFWPQMEVGESGTAFELGEKTDYEISLGDTYYGGSIDLATGLMTVTYYGETFTQCTDKWTNFDGHTQTSSTVSFQVNPQKPHALNHRIASNMFTIGNSNTGTNEFTHRGGVGTSTFKCSIAKNVLDLSGAANPENLTTSETYSAVNSFLSAHPLFIVYEVATPFTVQLSPLTISALAQPDTYTPRLNTVYSDQQSVQVGYPKSPLATSAELTNAIISLGSNL